MSTSLFLHNTHHNTTLARHKTLSASAFSTEVSSPNIRTTYGNRKGFMKILHVSLPSPSSFSFWQEHDLRSCFMFDKPWARPSQKRQSKKYNVWVPRCCCPYSVSYNRCSYVPSYSNTLHYSCLLEHSWVFKTASNLNWCLKKTPEKTEQQLGCSTQTRNEREAMMNTWIVNVRRQHVSPVARTMLMDV
jgi:hypothetical protein